MDVVKSRIQNSPKVAGQTPKYNWAWGACGTVMKEEGFGALYKGFLPKVLRLGPVSAFDNPLLKVSMTRPPIRYVITRLQLRVFFTSAGPLLTSHPGRWYSSRCLYRRHGKS